MKWICLHLFSSKDWKSNYHIKQAEVIYVCMLEIWRHKTEWENGRGEDLCEKKKNYTEEVEELEKAQEDNEEDKEEDKHFRC